MVNTIFISHAAPEDDNFARWVSLKLIGLGYNVWCDVIKLKGGEDWWNNIEIEIRENTVKFLIVLSRFSNKKDGVLKELAVAQKVMKKKNDSLFIIPLHIDSFLSYDDVNIELNRYNSINFKNSWADGLKMLLERFEEDNVPRSRNNYEEVSSLWNGVYLQDKRPINQEEIYVSNWFPITEIPDNLRFHKFNKIIPNDYDIKSLPYPVFQYKDYLATFSWCYDFMKQLPKTEYYSSKNSIEIPTQEIINGTFESKFIYNRTAKNIIISLVNKGFDATLSKKFSVYNMSNKDSYWIKKDVLEKDKFEKVLFVGKQKDKHWHFGISGNLKMFPELSFVINSHIWFTTDGETLIEEPSRQHASRRRQGRNWWNNDWRKKTLAFMKLLANGKDSFDLKLGSEELIKISSTPLEFKSPVSYNDPLKTNLAEDSYGVDFMNEKYEGDE